MTLLVGQKLYGYCGGYFDDRGHADKRVEAVGADWVVARDDIGFTYFASGSDVHAHLVEDTTPPEYGEGA